MSHGINNSNIDGIHISELPNEVFGAIISFNFDPSFARIGQRFRNIMYDLIYTKVLRQCKTIIDQNQDHFPSLIARLSLIPLLESPDLNHDSLIESIDKKDLDEDDVELSARRSTTALKLKSIFQEVIKLATEYGIIGSWKEEREFGTI